MKLDEKIVSHYESCNSPVDKEGYLYKKVRHVEQNFIEIEERTDSVFWLLHMRCAKFLDTIKNSHPVYNPKNIFI